MLGKQFLTRERDVQGLMLAGAMGTRQEQPIEQNIKRELESISVCWKFGEKGRHILEQYSVLTSFTIYK